MTDEIPCVLKLPESCQNSIGAFFADHRKSFCRELPAIVEGQHLGEQPHGFEGQVFIPEMVICHDRVATVFIDAIDCHVVIPPSMSWAGRAALTA